MENAIIQWGYNYLSSNGYTLESHLPDNVQNTPWSYVVRFTTTDGYIYLKHMPKLIALEPIITEILRDQFHASVPQVIANNMELDCFLMKDAGNPLRQILKKHFDTKLLAKGILQFTSLQLAVADHVDILMNVGVPDWRLEKLTDLYLQLLSKKDILMADGLSEIEINALEKLGPKISDLCQTLLGYAIAQTIVQPDFHDNNLLVDNAQNITIIDLGEIVISHPFFSLINCLNQAKKHHGLTDKDEAYQQLVDACLKNYRHFESESRLLEAFSIAKILLWVYGALANDRLMTACGRKNLMSFQPGRLANELKTLKAACTD